MGDPKALTSMQPIPRFVLDTSVALKWFLESGARHVSAARGLRNGFCEGRCRLSAPNLLLIELANALTTGHRASEEKVKEAVAAVQRLDIEFVAFDSGTLTKAVELAAAYGVTVYDTYFWAVAIDLKSTLVTADERFLRRVGRQPDIVPLSQVLFPG
jgi:predicted nucleic acid-binding protein